MITAIAICEQHQNATMSRVFARCHSFLIYNHTTKGTRIVSNSAASEGPGAGKKVVKTLSDMGVTRVVAGEFGVKTIQILSHINMGIIVVKKFPISALELIEMMKKADLVQA